MMRRTLILLLMVCLAIGCNGDAGGGDDTGSDAGSDADADSDSDTDDDGCADGSEIHCMLEDLTAPFVDPNGSTGKAIGLVVGVATLQNRYVTGFGATTIGGSTTPAADSIFDIASMTKVYTGYLLAHGQQNAEVALDDTLEDTFGPDVPTFDGQSIKLLDLATHTSGLPNFPDNMLAEGTVNPAAGYTEELLEQFLASYIMQVAPGADFEYSNLGSGTLGHILVTASGEASYEALVQREIAIPYGLVDTIIDPSPEQQARKLQGYDNSGFEAPALDIGDPLQGGGALRSTGDEVLAFFEGAIAGDDVAWEAVMTPHRESPNGVNAYTGLLLNIEDPDGLGIHSKNGVAPGFTTQVMFTTEPAALVVLLSNTQHTQGLYNLARTILEELESIEGF